MGHCLLPDEKVQRAVCLDEGGQEGYIFGGDLVLALRSHTKPLAASTMPSLAHAGAWLCAFVLTVLCPQSCLRDSVKWKVRVNTRVREFQPCSEAVSTPAGFCFPWMCGQ